MPGQRYTSDRRRNRGEATGGGRAVPLTGSKTARSMSKKPGPLAYDGDDKVVCPECGVGLDPNRRGAGKSPIPKHGRFGAPALGTTPPCRGWIDSLGGGDQ